MEININDYDFHGWATRANLKCSDGRTIMRDAFAHNDGITVPLVWNHRHNEPENTLGHALLENRSEGVYAYCSFNDTENGKLAKILVEHGDIKNLSIYANQLKQQGGNVLHGEIREVSLVHAGANPGATITSIIAHSDDGEPIESQDECIIHTGEDISLDRESINKESSDEMYHAENSTNKKEDNSMSDFIMHAEGEETVADVFNTLSEKQKTVVYAMIGQALEEAGANDDEGDDDDMKHNIFDYDERYSANVLTHSDQESILRMAKSSQVGTLQNALEIYAEENSLQHGEVGGFIQEGEGSVSDLFPEYKDLHSGAPELITNDQGWISTVMSKVHKSPISRLRTGQVDIRNIDALRAKGYDKGKQKKLTGNFKLVRRTTDPQTIYVKNALHRDDIVDITDFDYVSYLYKIDRMMLNEELATAILFGDGRDDGDDDKIHPDKIRPIWTDDDLYTLHVDIDLDKAKEELQGTNTGGYFGENYILAEALITACLYARENFKGSGTPDMYIDPHQLNVMLLARDMNGRRIYASKSELCAALNVGNIYTVEQMKNKVRTTEAGNKKLLCLIANLADYTLGATKGGEVTHFTQFDIDFNQEKSLLETRCSGALTKVYSAIAIEQPVTAG